MSSPHALLRLLWRPAMLLMLFPLCWAVLAPALVIGETLGNAVLDDFRSGGPSTALLHYALILGVMLPAATGLAAAMASLELQFTGTAWVLPGLRRRLLTGLVVLALPAAVAVAWLVARAASLPVAIAALPLALFWFAASLVVTDAAQPRLGRGAMAAAFVGVLLAPEAYVSFVSAQPAGVGAAAGALAVWMSNRHVAPAVRRRRPFIASQFSMGSRGVQLWWAEHGGPVGPWERSLAGGATADWLRAAIHEFSGMMRQGWPGFIAGNAVLAVIAYLASPDLLLMAVFGIAFAGIQLRMGLAYPLSRLQRARLLFLGNLLDVVLLTSILAAVLLTLELLHVPHFATDRPRTRYEWPAFLGLWFVLAPVAQWARVRGPLKPDAAGHFGRHLIPPALALVLAAVMSGTFVRSGLLTDAPMLAATVLALALTAQLIHWLALKRFYARADLAG